jgi:hypothetical protein
MKILQDPGRFQEFAQFGVQTMGRVAMIGVVVILVSVWALTEPFYELSKRIARREKLNKRRQIKN